MYLSIYIPRVWSGELAVLEGAGVYWAEGGQEVRNPDVEGKPILSIYLTIYGYLSILFYLSIYWVEGGQEVRNPDVEGKPKLSIYLTYPNVTYLSRLGS